MLLEDAVDHGSKLLWQKYEVAGHIASTVRKQRELNVGSHLTYAVYTA